MASAILKLDRNTGKYQVVFNGQLITESTAKYYLKDKVNRGVYKDLGIDSLIDESAATAVLTTPEESIGDDGISDLIQQFSIEDRFNFVRDVVTSVGKKQMNSAVILGEGGLGKSFTVAEGLKQAGLIDFNRFQSTMKDLSGDDEDDDGKVVVPKNAYVPIKGYSTARGLYETLYNYNGATLVFDDCDKVLVDPVAEMIFKGALDSNEERYISWSSSGGFGKTDIPKKFMFTGTIVFVSNRKMGQIDQALRSRSVCIDLTMTRDQKIERMWEISNKQSFMPETPRTSVKECMDEVERLKDRISDLNMRTLIKAVNLYNSVPDWKKVFEFVSVTN
jgi:hypothetical protein